MKALPARRLACSIVNLVAGESDFGPPPHDRAAAQAAIRTAYGLSPYFRLSIATSLGILEHGCTRIAAALRSLH
ncbi:MAG: hypothetical protein ACREE4_12820 [Stellaceae bacterium]